MCSLWWNEKKDKSFKTICMLCGSVVVELKVERCTWDTNIQQQQQQKHKKKQQKFN